MAVVEFDRQNKKDMYLAENCKIVGNLKSSGNIVIDGEIEGTIDTQGDFIIGRQGKVCAEIKAENVYVHGEVHGNISVANLLEITSTGVVYGDIKAKFLKIEQGGRFCGKSMDWKAIEEKAAENKPVNKTLENNSRDKISENKLPNKNSENSMPDLKPIVYNRLPDTKLSLKTLKKSSS
ncbi:MAG: polymer-forming cytoskeletal protein [Peptococcaceae bacterium]|nr:polymer-forming cytoskeletal protein [Peptococcaceae bacterium]